jgi:hypothetical protein
MNRQYPCGSWLRRSRFSLPYLKCGNFFSVTATRAPFLGLRPSQAERFRIVNEPKPRISTRSPRSIAATISLKMTLTILSQSRREGCGFCVEMRSVSSDFVMTLTSDVEVVHGAAQGALVVPPFGCNKFAAKRIFFAKHAIARQKAEPAGVRSAP